jgi:ribA/ribD-fused uncharacterized protein
MKEKSAINFDNTNTIYFYEPYDPYGYFCNLSDYPVTLDGKTWPTAEHYYQAQKHKNPDYREQIRQCPTPREAIALGRNESSSSFRSDDWMDVRVDVMRKVIEEKFSHNDDLSALLLATGEKKLVERSAIDSFWGDGPDGNGENWLGKVIMEVRDKLQKEKISGSRN